MTATREPSAASLLRSSADLVRRAQRELEGVIRSDPYAADGPAVVELIMALESVRAALENGARVGTLEPAP